MLQIPGGEYKVRSGYQLVAEELAQQRPLIEDLDAEVFPENNTPQAKSLIQITGSSNSGKSLLLWRLISRCLPPTYFGGKHCDVVLIDLGHKFSVPNFLQILKHTIGESKEQHSEQECAEVVQKCLESVIILDCFSSKEFELALDDLEDILLQNHNIGLIAIDDIDAYCWLEAQKKCLRENIVFANIVTKVQKLCKSHNVCCAFTLSYNHFKDALDNDSFNQLCASTDFVKYELHLDGNNKTLNGKTVYMNETGIHFAK